MNPSQDRNLGVGTVSHTYGFDRVIGQAVGSYTAANTTITIDGVESTKGPSPLATPGSGGSLVVQNTLNWQVDDNEWVIAEYHQNDEAWHAVAVEPITDTDTDELFKVSGDDTTAGYFEDKHQDWSAAVTFTTNEDLLVQSDTLNGGADETFRLWIDTPHMTTGAPQILFHPVALNANDTQWLSLDTGDSFQVTGSAPSTLEVLGKARVKSSDSLAYLDTQFVGVNDPGVYNASTDITCELDVEGADPQLRVFIDVDGSTPSVNQVLAWNGTHVEWQDKGTSADGKVYVDSTDAASGTREYLLDSVKDTAAYDVNTMALVKGSAVDVNNESMRLAADFTTMTDWSGAAQQMLVNDGGTVKFTTPGGDLVITAGVLSNNGKLKVSSGDTFDYLEDQHTPSATFTGATDVPVPFHNNSGQIENFLDVGGTYAAGKVLEGTGAGGSQTLVWGDKTTSDGKVKANSGDTLDYLEDQFIDHQATPDYDSTTDIACLVDTEADGGDDKMRIYVKGPDWVNVNNPPTGTALVPDASAVTPTDNATALQAMIDNKWCLVFPPADDNYGIGSTVTIPVKSGGGWWFAGGRALTTSFRGAASGLSWVGASAGGPMIECNATQFKFYSMSLCGQASESSGGNKASVGFQLETGGSLGAPGLGTGKVTFYDLLMSDITTGFKCVQGDAQSNADNTMFEGITLIRDITTGFWLTHAQNVNYKINHLKTGGSCGTAWKTDDGGIVTISQADISTGSTTLLDVNGGGSNAMLYDLSNIRLDGNADNCIIIDSDIGGSQGEIVIHHLTISGNAASPTANCGGVTGTGAMNLTLRNCWFNGQMDGGLTMTGNTVWNTLRVEDCDISARKLLNSSSGMVWFQTKHCSRSSFDDPFFDDEVGFMA